MLTVSGLFSVLSYLVEQRRKEIGVRMTLGATTPRVARLVLSEMGVAVGVGLLAGASLATGLATILRSLESAAWISTMVRMFDPGVFAGALAVIAAACVLATAVPVLRAARVDPVVTLRED